MCDEDSGQKLTFEWPELGQKIFVDPSDTMSTACIDYGMKGSRYASGFIEAGCHLANHMIETGHDLDILVYPMLQNFRHGIELQLKMLVPDCCAWLGVDLPDPEILQTHKLGKLWELVEPALKAVGGDGDGRKTLAAAKALLDELHSTDSSGQSFRYSTLNPKKQKDPKKEKSKKQEGAKSVVPTSGPIDSFPRKYLDVPQAAKQLTALSNFLSAARDHLDHSLDIRADYLSYLDESLPDDFRD